MHDTQKVQVEVEEEFFCFSIAFLCRQTIFTHVSLLFCAALFWWKEIIQIAQFFYFSFFLIFYVAINSSRLSFVLCFLLSSAR
jgi:hypothetical protein